ncbi:hypothetical protein CC80DRAFT_488754 [Byssothecium circinans]|uniref:Uncharacterized protein n=1 Tax=Byssothecium circinans TaxID=147558 RepID=A0A6A5UF21_9PLEO|nr:hypothetical protein CC80DRAFT_488754 [Byssothecium circinans]
MLDHLELRQSSIGIAGANTPGQCEEAEIKHLQAWAAAIQPVEREGGNAHAGWVLFTMSKASSELCHSLWR